MNTMTDADVVRRAVAGVRDRWSRRDRLEAAVRTGAGVAATWGAAWLAVRLGHLAGPALVAALVAGLVLTAVWVPLALRRRPSTPSDALFARHVEDLHPSLDDRLATAVDVASRPAAGPLDGALLADAVRALERESIDDVVPESAVRRATTLAAAMGALVLAVAIVWIAPARRALDVAGAFLFPGWLALDVTPGDARVAPGQPLEISARTGVADLVPEIEIAAAGRSKRLAMRQAGDTFRTRFDAVPGSFEYRVTAGGRTSRSYHVTLLEPPRLEGIDLHYEFPPYTKLPPRDERDSGDVYAPAGTTVRLSVRASKATESGALVMGNTQIPLTRAVDGPLVTTLPITSDGSYRVALTSRDGLASPGDTEYFIRVLDDRPPEVRILRPASDRQVSPLDEVTIEARADDDYGLQSFELVYSVRGGQARAVPFRGDRTPLTATGRHTLYLEDLDVAPGDFVTYYARARDVGRGKQATEARSDIYFLEVTPFDQEFSAAQSQAMGAGNGRSLDDLVTAQKDVVVATWKLDRRSGAGRSAADVKTVARAQGDVRQRTERAAAAMRGPRRRPSAGAGGDADPLASAAAAMARAEGALAASNTAAAVPPEMEALNHLLRAQAENRKRDVMRQQAGMGGGGGNRAQQDLSSLFDRELKRQQQTNYETPRTAEEREQNGAEDLLERLRALAARQEQLARQQDDLARSGEQLQAEERRRRLERLTREQTDVRRQAEQLAQQMQSSKAGAQERGGSPQSSPSQSAAGLRDASEDMQAAAGDLRRDDPRQASGRSARAAERLRGLERQLQGRSPDERRRALGDLQLEARQLADRQRQLGEEAAATRGPSSADAARRLATEQDRLADRADRLEQQVDALGRARSGKPATSVAEAGRELKEQHVGDRMRDAARSMRDGAGTEGAAPRAAGAGRQAARALDRLADRLGDASGDRDPAERRLSDQLSRARDVREQMGDLQRRIAELQQPAQPGASGAGNKEGGAQGRRESGQQPSPASGGKGQGGQSAGENGAPQAGDAARSELERLKREYAEQVREAARLRGELEGRQGTAGGGDGAGSTPEGQLMVLSAPGTEAFKQDFSKWEVLHKDVTLGLERLEATLSQRLLDKALRERLPAGPADDAPDEYRDAVARYFRSIAAPRD